MVNLTENETNAFWSKLLENKPMRHEEMKRRISTRIGIGTLLFLLLVGCKQAPQLPANQLPPNDENAKLITLNKGIVNAEQTQMMQYIHQHKLNMQKDSMGFWVTILHKGKGALPKNNNIITYQYSISLLDGTLCFSNENTDKTSTLQIGHAKTIRGIELGLKKLQQGGDALILLPSILGYSVSGHGRSIPPYSPLVIHLRMLKINP